MKKILLYGIVFLGLMISFIAQASDLAGYIYTDNIGWISFYNVVHNKGSLSGYGYSESTGWINFNPQYNGVDYGVKIDNAGNLSGWAYSEKNGWVLIDDVKIVLAEDLNNNIISVENEINKIDVIDASVNQIKVLIKELCEKILNKSKCDSL